MAIYDGNFMVYDEERNDERAKLCPHCKRELSIVSWCSRKRQEADCNACSRDDCEKLTDVWACEKCGEIETT